MGAPLGATSHDAVSGERIAVAHCTRARTARAMAQATRELYGDVALAAIVAALPEGAPESVDDNAWIPIEQVIRWCELAWDGPLRRDPAHLAVWVDRMTDHGFGRVRKLLLTIATPADLGPRDLRQEESGRPRLAHRHAAQQPALHGDRPRDGQRLLDDQRRKELHRPLRLRGRPRRGAG